MAVALAPPSGVFPNNTSPLSCSALNVCVASENIISYFLKVALLTSLKQEISRNTCDIAQIKLLIIIYCSLSVADPDTWMFIYFPKHKKYTTNSVTQPPEDHSQPW